MLNFATHVYLPRLTLECQLFKFSFHHLDLPSIVSQTHSYPITWTYLWVPVWLRFWLCHAHLLDQTYNSDAILTRLKPFNRLDHLYLLILKSLALLQQHFLNLYFLTLCMLFPIPLSSSHCLNPVGFPSFILPHFQQNTGCKCYALTMQMKYHDRSYQCDMQTLCPNILLIDSEPPT